ncbi:succinoglycan biosynthesis transporter [Candidatus Levyibacteriota bacterium]|nr:succinoglycan biosynthesis transporter [Candidatus Levybacteria bacterium]
MSLILIIKNAGFQALAKVITSLSTLAISLFIAFSFGENGYGEFTKVVTFIGILAIFLDFGLNPIFLKENNSLYQLITLRIFMATVLVVAGSLLILSPISSFFLFSNDANIGVFVLLFSLFPLSIQLSVGVYFQKHLRYYLQAYHLAVGGVTTVILIGLVTIFEYPFLYIFISMVIGGIVASLMSYLLIVKKESKSYPIDLIWAKKLLKSSTPLALMMLFNLIYFRADIFILSYFKSSSDVGIYGFAYRFFDFLVAVPLFFSNALYPSLLLRKQSGEALFVKKHLLLFLMTSIGIVLVGWIFAPLIGIVRPGFILSILPFRLLLLSLPIFFLSSYYQWILIVDGDQKALVFIYLFCGVLNIILNIIFIPYFSYIGASLITGVSEFIVFALLIGRLAILRKNL